MLFREAAAGVSVSVWITLRAHLSSPKGIQLIHQNDSVKQSNLQLVEMFRSFISKLDYCSNQNINADTTCMTLWRSWIFDNVNVHLELDISTEHNSKLPVFESVHKELECIFKTLKKQQNASARCV